MSMTATIPFRAYRPRREAWAGDREMQSLLDWFETADLPVQPFDLIPAGENAVCCLRVLVPVAFYAALRAEAERGPAAPGAPGLRANLTRLHALFETRAVTPDVGGRPLRPKSCGRGQKVSAGR